MAGHPPAMFYSSHFTLPPIAEAVRNVLNNARRL